MISISQLHNTRISPTASALRSQLPAAFSQIQEAKVRPSPLSSTLTTPMTSSRGSTLQAKAFKLQDLIPKNPFQKEEPIAIPKTTFADVAGIDEAKFELQEVVDFLKNPTKYTDLGATIPKGILLSGQPGTGKTLLAKAIAGESGVPFFAASGSEFVEMYVGMGASRVRKLFNEAKENAPCILFIDEIDAMGKNRSGASGANGGSDEREQTLNQMLTEMDGFSGNTGVIVVAATNRADVLDPALKRAGRFDRQIEVPLPDRTGREAILKVHSQNKKLDSGVSFNEVAKRTPGFSGADLANIMNESAINTVRRGAKAITYTDIDTAIDTSIAGAKKLNSSISQRKREVVANHEAGHAIVAAMVKGYDQVQKISIEPRGKAAGLTWYLPDADRIDSGLYTRQYLANAIVVALGGRAAEEIAFGENNVTTGASNDMQKVTSIALQMITNFACRLKHQW